MNWGLYIIISIVLLIIIHELKKRFDYIDRRLYEIEKILKNKKK